ncbi:MAG TPA: SURF1 family protein [Gemmatimonadaceae bacterium]
MPRRIVAFIVLAVVLAAVFVRLGFWQLSRLSQRRAQNAVIARHLAEAETPWDKLGPPDSARLRRTVVLGVPDTAQEFAILGRSRNGSPGVWIITPVRVAGDTAAVLVNRGWVYSPDASTVDLSRWRERRTEFRGYTQPLLAGPANVKARGLRSFDSGGVDSLLPYPFAPVYLVLQDSGAIDSTPARLPLPVLNDGPHLSYAIQWFCFAAIAVGGAAIVGKRARDSELAARHSP